MKKFPYVIFALSLLITLSAACKQDQQVTQPLSSIIFDHLSPDLIANYQDDKYVVLPIGEGVVTVDTCSQMTDTITLKLSDLEVVDDGTWKLRITKNGVRITEPPTGEPPIETILSVETWGISSADDFNRNFKNDVTRGYGVMPIGGGYLLRPIIVTPEGVIFEKLPDTC